MVQWSDPQVLDIECISLNLWAKAEKMLAFQTTVNQTFLDDDSYPRILANDLQPASGFAFINTMYELYVAEQSLALSPCRWPAPPESAEWMDVFFWVPKKHTIP